jgi:iron-sulfur cluster assembly protein
MTGLTISDEALEQAMALRNKLNKPEDWGIRISVRGGGCSGFMYDLDFCQPGGEDGDRAFDFDGISLYCDRKSYLFVIGTRLDWEDSLQSTGFVFKNPNETGACGCGESVLF